MIKILENTDTENWRLEIEALAKMKHSFTIFQYKIKEPSSSELSTPLYLEVWLFWSETGMLSPNPNLYAFHRCNN